MNIRDEVYFHEDNYRQIELLPVQNLLNIHKEADLMKEQTEKAFTPDGFVTMSVIEETKYPLNTLKISATDFENFLREYALFYFSNVYTGYSTYRELKTNLQAFGFENYVLYYESSYNILTNAWINYNLLSDTLDVYPENLESALFKLGSTYKLILMDWNELVTVFLKDRPALKNYFNFLKSDI